MFFMLSLVFDDLLGQSSRIMKLPLLLCQAALDSGIMKIAVKEAGQFHCPGMLPVKEPVLHRQIHVAPAPAT
jgi:hypothetical protein